MRKGEAANLQPGDLDFDAATIRVRPEVSKTRQPRLIAMDEASTRMISLNGVRSPAASIMAASSASVRTLSLACSLPCFLTKASSIRSTISRSCIQVCQARISLWVLFLAMRTSGGVDFIQSHNDSSALQRGDGHAVERLHGLPQQGHTGAPGNDPGGKFDDGCLILVQGVSDRHCCAVGRLTGEKILLGVDRRISAAGHRGAQLSRTCARLHE